ncbi:MAG TPA: hypothetical protein VKZ99_08870 [Gammaproteobacteria bacterium]|nr:hypothetical protein [Gammaproteobacteria bacterium]
MKMNMLLLALTVLLSPFAANGADQEIVTSPGKPAHPIAMSLEVPKWLQAGETADATLLIGSRLALASVEVELLRMTNVTAAQTHFSLGAGGEYRLPLRLTATAADTGSILVEVRATTTTGTLLTRQLELAATPEVSLLRKSQLKRERGEVQKVEPGEDVIVPAEQRVRD